MDDILFSSANLHAPLKFLTSLAIGLLLGLQRERTPSAKAGVRTFALVALFGTVSGLIADAADSAWIIAAGLALVGLMIIAAYRREDEKTEADSGTTTVIALLLCFGLGVMVWHDRSQLAVSVAIVATLLLHFKTELHGLSARLSRQDVASILQFAVLTFIILPLLPDRGIGPYRVLNPHHVWLMVVLVSGVSLIGYLALRLAGTQRSLLLVGAFGGLVSSTATTLVYAREAHARPAMLPIGGAIIVIANLVVLVRLAVMSAVVAPGALLVLLPVLGTGLALGAALLVVAALGLVFGFVVYGIAVHRVIDAPHLSSLLATFSVNMIILGVGTAAFTTSPRNIDFPLGSVQIGPLTLQGTRLIAALVSGDAKNRISGVTMSGR